MGAVFRPKDRKVVENAVKDFGPDTKDNVIKLLSSQEEKKSANKMRQILGENKTEELLRNIVEKEDVNFSEDERIRLRNIFRESLTFD